ncbi:hypothetical protein M422DRAFT_45118 [Sphaerobolus stellatus SS14]|nr:hypothetical protein M422DRAFT_45118 [Sphaerobolus stellatus SS14]
MLVIDPSSYCDVCCESFTTLPECIECGHILCSNCLDSVCEKTWTPRTLPACPFCRETFAKASSRKVRVDLKTPRPPLKEVDDDDDSNGNLSQPSDAKRLEEKVAKAAASKTSFEEVQQLHKEIQQWLTSEVKRTSTAQRASLKLSAALLRAILLNYIAYNQASSDAKSKETTLQSRLEEANSAKNQLEMELVKHRSMYSQKVRECQDLRTELNRLQLVAAPTGASSSANRPLAITAPPRNAMTPSPLSRSSTASVRSSTPHPSPTHRSSAYPARPASTMPSLSSSNSHNRSFSVGSAPSSNTMASALRYQSSPLKSRVMTRPISPPLEEGRHERWIPHVEDDDSVVNVDKRLSSLPVRPATAFGISTASAAAAARSPRGVPRNFHTPAPVL